MDIISGLVLKRLGIDFAVKSIGAITSSANGISSLISAIRSDKNAHDISKLLKKLDIEMSVRVLKMLISEINLDEHCTATLLMSLVGLNECLMGVEEDLRCIKRKLSHNNSLWISWHRCYTFNEHVDTLTILKETLDIRQKLLFDVVKINDHLTKNDKAFSEMNKYIGEMCDSEYVRIDKIEGGGNMLELIDSSYMEAKVKK